jgi:hypothetical protein
MPSTSMVLPEALAPLVHDEKAPAVHQHHESAEADFHGVLGDAVPDLRRAVVMAERVVDGGDKMQPVADDRDDLAIAGVAHALHGVADLDRLRRRDASRGENEDCCACSNEVYHRDN